MLQGTEKAREHLPRSTGTCCSGRACSLMRRGAGPPCSSSSNLLQLSGRAPIPFAVRPSPRNAREPPYRAGDQYYRALQDSWRNIVSRDRRRRFAKRADAPYRAVRTTRGSDQEPRLLPGEAVERRVGKRGSSRVKRARARERQTSRPPR